MSTKSEQMQMNGLMQANDIMNIVMNTRDNAQYVISVMCIE